MFEPITGYKFDLPKHHKSIIKVIGVGGGGSNAVNHMFQQDIKDVEFVVANTDLQALNSSPVPYKLQLGVNLTEGLGCGANPEVGRAAAIESKEQIREMLMGTKMVFVTAGMGGGTGTGAAPVIAKIAKAMDILTVGIVTVPFAFEGKKKIAQAELGIDAFRSSCDTVLIILNDKLREIYGNLAIGDLQPRLGEQERISEERMRETMALAAQLAAEQQRAKGLLERLEQQKTELEQLHARMTTEFENIAGRLLMQRGKELNEQQQAQLTGILKPLQERIKEFEEKVQKAYDEEGRQRFALKSEIARLVEQNQKLSQDASDLTKALKGDSQAQGAWGEMILEKLLESSGLVPGQEYSMEESTTLSDGSRLPPDAVIMLPEGKHLIIDSKVSLLHYERFAASTDTAEKDRLLKLHVESLRAHARGLSEKDYTKLYAVHSVDFVLMFVPIEPAFLLALRERPEIFQEAYDRQVVMVKHSTLMATLRTIHGIWKNERIARNHLEIADRAGKLYDKFIGFTEDLIKVGNQLKLAKGSYDDAMGKLSEGSGNLVRQVEMIKELGAKTNKGQNDKLLQLALEE